MAGKGEPRKAQRERARAVRRLNEAVTARRQLRGKQAAGDAVPGAGAEAAINGHVASLKRSSDRAGKAAKRTT